MEDACRERSQQAWPRAWHQDTSHTPCGCRAVLPGPRPHPDWTSLRGSCSPPAHLRRATGVCTPPRQGSRGRSDTQGKGSWPEVPHPADSRHTCPSPSPETGPCLEVGCTAGSLQRNSGDRGDGDAPCPLGDSSDRGEGPSGWQATDSQGTCQGRGSVPSVAGQPRGRRVTS